MNEVGVEIVKTEETEKSGIKYLNINVSNSEVERKPDIVRLCADAGILEYVKPSGDLISRQAVQDYIAKYLSQYLYNDVREAVEVIDEYIGELPSVNPQEPKTGHWIGIDEEPHEDWECDNCGFVIWADENIEKFHYCPNCGCRMFEPQESEE